MVLKAFVPSAPVVSNSVRLRCVTKQASWKMPGRRRTRITPVCKSQSPQKSSPQELLWRVPPTVAYVLYMNHLFFQSPTGSVPLQSTLLEAAQLSLNFCYITPLLQPHNAPVIHPVLEGLFHLDVSWALLLLGFVSEDNPPRRRPPAATPFFVAAAFLTNIIYIPYIILREKPAGKWQSPSNAFQRLGESVYLPVFCVTLTVISSLWALFARPEYGDLQTRIASFKKVLFSDLLAYSFGVDLIMYSLFQSWLVRDDANRRTWKDDSTKSLAVNATIVPFFGLAYYLIQRARHTTKSKRN